MWGRGVGTDAQRLTIARAFDEFRAHRVLELILADNERARKVVERLGFRLEGIMRGHVRRGGRLLDVAVYGLLPEDFSG
jgi:RimJ/RimL family protein N-acetyltransferase